MSTDPQFASRHVGVPALEELGRRFEIAFEAQPRRSPAATRLRLGVAASVLALVAFVGLTPAGRAVAEDVAELIGIDHLVVNQSGFSGGLGRGTLAGEPYTVSVSGQREPGETCIFVAFDNAPGSDMGSCQGQGVEQVLAENTVLPFVYRPAEGVADDGAMIQTLASREVNRLEVEYTRRDGAPHVETMQRFILPSEAVERIGLPSSESVAFFVALLPKSLPTQLGDPDYDAARRDLIESIDVVAYDGGGHEIMRSELTDPADAPHPGNYASRLDKPRIGELDANLTR